MLSYFFLSQDSDSNYHPITYKRFDQWTDEFF